VIVDCRSLGRLARAAGLVWRRRLLAAATLALTLGHGGGLHAAEWAELASAERQVLAPLAKAWPALDEPQRKRWRALASRWSTLPAAEQWRLTARMQEWAELTPAARAAARLQFQEASRLPADSRHLAWQAYQSLSEEERRELAGKPRPAAPAAATAPADAARAGGKDNWVSPTVPPRAQAAGASTRQVQPGASTVPMNRPALPPAPIQHGMPKIATSPGFVDRETLLPQRGPQGAAATPARAASAASAPRAASGRP
jgi:hypothetical protein